MKFLNLEDKMKTLQKNREEALAAHELARTRMAEQGKSTFVPFKQGDKVWLDTRIIKMNYHKKIRPKREGLFEILKVLGPVTYRLKLPSTWKIHPIFHATLLRQYKETDVYGAYQYYVAWKGYPISEASWEPEQVFSDDGDLLTTYKLHHQL